MKTIALLIAAALVLSAGLALAQAQGTAEEPVVEVVKDRTELIFNELELTGEIPKPSAQYWVGKRQVQFDSQIRVRQNFVPEVVGSADAL